MRGFENYEDDDEPVGYDGDAARKRMKEREEGGGGGSGPQYRIGEDISRFWIGKGETHLKIVLTPHMLFSIDVHRETPLPQKGAIYDACRKTAGMGHMLYPLTSGKGGSAADRAQKLKNQAEPRYEVLSKHVGTDQEQHLVRLPVPCEQDRIRDVGYQVRKRAEQADSEGSLNAAFWESLTDDEAFCYANSSRFWRAQTTPFFVIADLTGFTGNRGDQLGIGRRQMVMATDTLIASLDNLRASLEAEYEFDLETLVGCVVRVTRSTKDKSPELGDSWVPMKAWAPRGREDKVFDDKTFAKIVEAMGLPENAKSLPGRMNAKQLDALASVLGKPGAYTTDLMDADAGKPQEDRWRRFLAKKVQPLKPEVIWSVKDGVISHRFDWTELYRRVNCVKDPDRRKLGLPKKEEKGGQSGNSSGRSGGRDADRGQSGRGHDHDHGSDDGQTVEF